MTAAVVPMTWTSADCRSEIPRHAACVMSRSCACWCHRPRAERLRDTRDELEQQIARLSYRRDQINRQLHRLAHPTDAEVAEHREHEYRPGVLALAIRDVIQPGEIAATAMIVRRVQAAWGVGRWQQATIETQVCITCGEGVIERAGRGLYRLPTGTVTG